MTKNLVKLFVGVMILATLLSGCGNNNNDGDTSNVENPIKVGTSGTYYPYTYMKDDKLVGFDIEVWNEIGKRLGREIQWELSDFDGMFGMLDAGKIDVAAHQISITPARLKKYAFSEIYAYNPYKLYVRKDDNSINGLEDLEGKKVVCSATSIEKEFLENYDKEKKINLIISSGIDAADVDMGHADAAFGAIVHFEDRMEQGGYSLKLVGDTLIEEENAYPFRKEEESMELKNEVDEVIKEMHRDGTLSKLSEKILGVDITKKEK